MYLIKTLYAVFAIDICDFKHLELIRVGLCIVIACGFNAYWYKSFQVGGLGNGKTFCAETTK